MDLDLVDYEGLRCYSRWFDRLHESDALFEKLGYIDVRNLARRVRAEVLFGSGLADEICPPSTHFAVYNKADCAKYHAVFPKFAHEPVFRFENIYLQFLTRQTG